MSAVKGSTRWHDPRQGCIVCGSGTVRLRWLDDGRAQHLCRAHEYACPKHLKDPCPICDGGEPDPDDKA